VARALIVGCGCFGRELGGELAGRGWQVRGTSRTPVGLTAIEAAGLEAAPADPDRPGTILELCADVATVVWLLGSPVGPPENLAAINGPRLERLLEKLVDTPVRGIAYEAVGSAPSGVLKGGREIVERAGVTWHIPVSVLELERSTDGWTEAAARSVERLLAAG
jgi:nucleoside-diphosphate-sugar epimerase